MMDRRSMLFLSVALALDACASQPTTSAQTARGANFSAYRTFGWAGTTPPAGMNPVAYQQIISDVEAALEQKGYTKADPGDLTLILSVGAQNRLQFESFGALGLQRDVYQYTEGQLAVDAFDTKTKQAVWHGVASEEIHPERANPAAIDTAVSQLMTKFPASGSSGVAAGPAS
jgi:hypothetical protein